MTPEQQAILNKLTDFLNENFENDMALSACASVLVSSYVMHKVPLNKFVEDMVTGYLDCEKAYKLLNENKPKSEREKDN